MVGLAKSTLAHQLQGDLSLDWSELDSLFCEVANIINNRPLGVRTLSDGDYHAITPNDLLLGRAQGIQGEADLEDTDEVDVQEYLSRREELVRRWWGEWYRKVFPTLLPRKKWHTSHRNVCEGDIVLVLWEGKIVNKFSWPWLKRSSQTLTGW